ncbi:MAG: hypothetical protein U0353_35260 [Sandaracinus sp.]
MSDDSGRAPEGAPRDDAAIALAWQSAAYRVWYELHGFVDERRDQVVTQHELRAGMGPAEDVPEAVAIGRAQKVVLGVLRARLESEPSLAHRFVAQPGWPWLAKLVAAIRLRELASAKIVQRGARARASFDVSGLARTYHGKALLKSLGFERRKVLEKDELAKLEAACAKIKLTLPRVVEPTTTERFFSGEPAASDTSSDTADTSGDD